MEIHPWRTEGLGDSTYLLTHRRFALVVDPQRDIDRFLDLISGSGAELRFVLETHVHNDYLSGGPELARVAGAELVVPAAAAPAYRHRPAFHMEDLVVDGLVVRPLHTPGHTPEHTSYLILLENEPVAIFSGGSLLVGSAGRSDLLGPERAEALARLQHQSVHRLADLPDQVGLFPTHGEGSFCTTAAGGGHTSTIGAEKKSNPVLAYADEDSFVAGELSDLGPWPSYYSHMGPANLRGAAPMPDAEVPVLDAGSLSGLPSDVAVVDARDRQQYARGHLPGSLAIELGDRFGTWVGWIVPYGAPLVLVMDQDQDLVEALTQLRRIGFDDVVGVVNDLTDPTLELVANRVVDVSEFAAAAAEGAQVLDVRGPEEQAAGTIPGSIESYVPDLALMTPDEVSSDSEVWVACESGYRASLAASLLEARGFRPVVLVDAGIAEVLTAQD